MNRVDMLQAFRRKSNGEVFFADSIDAVSGKCFSELSDKEALLMGRFWSDAVFGDIDFDELNRLGLEFYESIPVSFPQYGQGFLFGIQVVKVKGCHLTGPCT